MSKETIDFINQHANDVIKSVKGTGLFPSVAMAQMIIESSGPDAHGVFGIGKDIAVRKANNYFGIKADKSWQGPKVALSTPRDGQPVNYFRVYSSALDSLQDHTRFLLKNSRYKTSGVFSAKTPLEQTQALQRSGYSESPSYGKALMSLIQAYHLDKLDNTPSSGAPTFIALTSILLLLLGGFVFRDAIKAQLQKFSTHNQLLKA